MNTITSKGQLVSLVVGLVGAIQSANAASIQVTGSFNNESATSPYYYSEIVNQDNNGSPVSLPPNLNSSTDSVAYFGWGIDVYDSFIEGDIIQSHFGFNGVGSAGSSPSNILIGDTFSLGSFTYTNEQTILSGGYVEIDFQMDIAIDGLFLAPVEYRIGIDNTRNSLPNSDDTATLLSMPSDLAFMLDGSQYLLTFNGFSRDGGLSFEDMATLPEGSSTSAEIFATITAVPVPAALWLMISGGALLGFAARRKP